MAARVPDLYVGEPVVVRRAHRGRARSGNVVVSGRRDGATWSALLPSPATANEAGVGVLWARAKIAR